VNLLPVGYNETSFTGNLIPGTSLYSSFKVTGYDPQTKTSIVLSYSTGTPYSEPGGNPVPVYHWYVIISNPLLYTNGSLGYMETDYSPYNVTGLPGGVAGFIANPSLN
jgi:hypothetical protein